MLGYAAAAVAILGAIGLAGYLIRRWADRRGLRKEGASSARGEILRKADRSRKETRAELQRRIDLYRDQFRRGRMRDD